jgi:hypothetical protein
MGLALGGLASTDGARAWPVFERGFREFGLPRAILSDNGPPFVAPRGLRGLSRLSVWWLRLGIQPIRTEPASPEYPDPFRILPVNGPGSLYIDGENQHLSGALAGERIGMEETDDGIWTLYFCKERLARYDERTRTIER